KEESRRTGLARQEVTKYAYYPKRSSLLSGDFAGRPRRGAKRRTGKGTKRRARTGARKRAKRRARKRAGTRTTPGSPPDPAQIHSSTLPFAEDDTAGQGTGCYDRRSRHLAGP